MIDFFLKAINVSIAGCWLILAVALIRMWRRVPRYIICLMWGADAIRLIVPYLSGLIPIRFISRLSMVPSVETVSAYKSYLGSSLTVSSGLTQPDMAFARLHASALNTYGDIRLTQITGQLLNIAVMVWLCGIAAMLIYASVSYIVLRLRVRESVPDGGIMLCDRISSPFVLGFFRPGIYLPSGMDETARASVTAHEKAHIRRGDYFWRLIGWLLLSFYWFSPLIWMAFIMYCRDTELACDEAVIKGSDPEGIKAYSEALLSAGTRKLVISFCPLAFGETGVKARIKAALSYRKPTAVIIVISILLCCLSVICFGASNTAYDGGIVKLIASLRPVPASTSFTDSQSFDIKTDGDVAGMILTAEVWKDGRIDQSYASLPFTADDFSLTVRTEMNNTGIRYTVPGIYDLYGQKTDDIVFYLGYPKGESYASSFTFADLGGVTFSPGHSVYLACRDCRSGNSETGMKRFAECNEINETPKILKETEYTAALRLDFYDREETDRIINQCVDIGVNNPYYKSKSDIASQGTIFRYNPLVSEYTETVIGIPETRIDVTENGLMTDGGIIIDCLGRLECDASAYTVHRPYFVDYSAWNYAGMEQRLIAVDPDVIPIGTVLYIDCPDYDIGIVTAVANGRNLKGNQIEIFMGDDYDMKTRFNESGGRKVTAYVLSVPEGESIDLSAFEG